MTACRPPTPLELPAQLLARLTWGVTELEMLIGTSASAVSYLQTYRDGFLRELDRLVDELRPEDRDRLERLAVPPDPDRPVGVGLTDVAEVVGVGLLGSAWDQIDADHPTSDVIHIRSQQITHSRRRPARNPE